MTDSHIDNISNNNSSIYYIYIYNTELDIIGSTAQNSTADTVTETVTKSTQ